MNFAYGEVLAVLEALSDSHQLAIDDGRPPVGHGFRASGPQTHT